MAEKEKKAWESLVKVERSRKLLAILDSFTDDKCTSHAFWQGSYLGIYASFSSLSNKLPKIQWFKTTATLLYFKI